MTFLEHWYQLLTEKKQRRFFQSKFLLSSSNVIRNVLTENKTPVRRRGAIEQICNTERREREKLDII